MKALLRTTALTTSLMFIANAAIAGDITGRVSDKSGNISLDGAQVRLMETGATVTTDRAGLYRFAGLKAGTYTLQISYVGADPETVTVTLGSDTASERADISLGANIDVMENILVIGQRGALNSALSRQRASDRLITVLSADAIGQLPDENVAEAARRAVGVNVLNDQGEGRFVSIRGASPAFVTSTINGVRLTSPEADGRQVPLDVIDSDILSSITITKTLTPDVDGDSIGGNVEITTLSGLDQNDMVLRMKAAAIYTEQTEEFGQRYSGVFADNFMDGKFGIAASLAWQERRFGSENIEMDGPDYQFTDTLAYPEELELRDYQITRERWSASLNLDFQATDNLKLYAHGLFSDFSDQEYRSRVENKFGDPEFVGADGNIAVVDAGLDDPYEVDRDIKDRLEKQRIWSGVTGFEYVSGTMEIDALASYSYADEREPNRLDTDFRGEFDSGIFAVDMSDPILPSLVFGGEAERQAYYDARNYEFNGLEFTNGKSEDDEFAAALNAKFMLDDLIGKPSFVKFGGKMRLREKSYNLDLVVYEDADVTLADFRNTIAFALEDINPVPSGPAMRDFFNASRNSLEINEFDSIFASTEADYQAEEDVYAGYGMFQSQITDRFTFTGGVRVERTEFAAFGQALIAQEFEAEFDTPQVTDNPLSLVDPSITGIAGNVLFSDLGVDTDDDGNVTAVEYEAIVSQPAMFTNTYTDWLPSALLRYDMGDDMVLRAGYFRSIVRPNLEDASPRTLAEQGEDGLVAETGNPNLRRQQAENFDITFEYYPGNKAVYSAGFFYKDIADFIARQQFNNATFNGNTYDELDTFVNLDDARLWGIELNVQQPLDMLPGFLSGFIISANYTYVDGEATLADGRDITIPGQSEHVATAILGWEKGPWNIRLAATYRDEFLDEISVSEDFDENPLDRIVDDHFQLDLSAKYRFTPQWQAFFEMKNLNDEPFLATVRSSRFGRLNAQYEEYGFSMKLGLSFIL